MQVIICAPCFRWTQAQFTVQTGSAVGDVLDRVTRQTGVSSLDFFITCNGRLSHLEDPLQDGGVYHLEPRLRGGKGGFGSMLRALGAQIEKTTNREACRDLSGRRLRDVNHEKEMAEWLKKQSDREAEKEQRRLERLQRKLSEPKHQFMDTEYQQQCHNLSERLEDSVLKGLQASSSAQVNDCNGSKRPNLDQNHTPLVTKKKRTAACLWMGMDEMLSSEEEEESLSTSSGAAVAMAMQTEVASTVRLPSPPRSSRDQSPEPRSRPAEASSSSQQCPPVDPQAAAGEQSPPLDPQTAVGEQQPPVDPQAAARELSPPVDPQAAAGEQHSPVDLQGVESVEQLEALGLDILKEELMLRGLKCGGTLVERAARLFAIRGMKADQIDPALLAKPSKAKRK
ncbi:splicing regulator SDE2 isoform X2 [Sphaeramia orbicularis]|uniref:splicing regulator SDE2 isoform X2 n=1 Tax=Sphaeramia orbicularis TaxID=375764 RepID=UPI00117E0FD4|nr:replication stress response regulator SDE2 isoform X2 [Sphaeramia orbicularis]